MLEIEPAYRPVLPVLAADTVRLLGSEPVAAAA
jgi:hypothetical protein